MRKALFVALALVVTACGGSSSDTTVTTDIIDPGPEPDAATFYLTEADSRAVLRVQPGDEIVARLSADGPPWQLEDGPDPDVVAGGDSFLFEPSEGGSTAAYQEFTFLAVGEGSTEITIIRDSETLTFTVEVG